MQEQPALQVKGLQEPMRTFLVLGVRERRLRGPVSYTHLDVYKRQVAIQMHRNVALHLSQRLRSAARAWRTGAR